MFIWDFAIDVVLGQLMDWIYGQIVGFLGSFFSSIGGMGAELFEMTWVQAVVQFFYQLGWVLYAVGLVMAVFECAIEYQAGRGSVRDTALNALKGFLAVGLFTTVPVQLYQLCVSLQGTFTSDITGMGADIGAIANNLIVDMDKYETLEMALENVTFGGISRSPLMLILILVMMGYSVIKVFFSNLKRGGILLIQISVGSLYMFSVPRGYQDGFISWCKQVIGLCLTAFLQATILTAGLMVIRDKALIGLGLMLSAGEVPRIAGQFGLDTGTKANVMSAVYTAQSVVNTTRTIVRAVAAK